MSSFSLFFLVCFHLLICFSCGFVSGTPCSGNQSSLLLKLKQGFSFPMTPRLASWVAGSDCCLWEGVTCDNTTGHVIGLDLTPSFNFNDIPQDPIFTQIDPSLFQLHSLRSLNLSYINNYWVSDPIPIPSGFERLTYLTHLNLSNAGFSGQIPLQITNLSRLVSLDLSWCQLELGQDQLLERIFQLPNLHTLQLSGNKLTSSEYFPFVSANNNVPLQFLGLQATSLTAPLLNSILNLKFLNHLDIAYNQLMTMIPEKLGDLKFLNHLDLSYNQLAGGMPEKLGNLKFLNHLDLSNNRLTGGIPKKLGDLKVLNHLDFSHNRLMGGIPEILGALMLLNHLDLSHNNLTGEIPKTIGNLELLSLLDISNNSLTGGIPLSFGLLLKLTQLSLSNNKLNGTIPSFLLNHPSLQILDLRQNLFHGLISEFTNLSSSSLLTLDLSNNKLNGPIPSSISYLNRLVAINLSSNNFSGTVDMRWFHKFMNLSILGFSHNNFMVKLNNVSIDNTPLLSQLEVLMLSSCKISEFPWFFLHNQRNLFLLDLSNNEIHGTIPNWIWKFKDLSYLNLSNNLLTSIEQPYNLPSHLDVLDLHANMLEGPLPIPPSASILDYSFNRFASIIPTYIGHYLKYTNVLSLSNNKFVGEIPPTICNSDFLDILDISNNNLSGSIPQCLTNMMALSIVNLRGNDLQGNIPDTFIEGISLRTLDLNSNRLSGSVPKSLPNCTNLEILDLGNNYLNGTFPIWLENLPRLTVLILRSNQFYGLIKPNQTRQGFQRLQIIDLSTNNFTGNLPVKYFQSWKFMMKVGKADQNGPEDMFLRFEGNVYGYVVKKFVIHNAARDYYQDLVKLTSKRQEMVFKKIWTVFTSIDLSNNKFHGRIPEDLGNLKILTVLNLSRNNLDGQIPTSLGNLSSVESMDLSHNNLSGEIPTQLIGLDFLQVLDLSHNRLTGRIPGGAHFSTFENTSFEGNLGLCGPPLSSNCTSTPTEDVEPMIPPVGIDDEVIMNRQEIIVGGIVGLFCGMALVIWPLLFWRRWRRWYYIHVDIVLLWISTCISHRRG